MRKLLALLIIVMLVFPLLMATLSVMSVSQWVLDRSFYERLLGDRRLYEVMLNEDLPNYLNNRRPVPQADMIPAGALSAALRTVLTPDDLQAQSLRLVNDFFDTLEGRQDQFNLYLDTTQLKSTLQTTAGAQKFALALATSLPNCTAGQNAVATGGVLMRCLPTDKSAEAAADEIAAALPEFLKSVPDHINLERETYNTARWTRGVPMMFAATNGLNIAIVILLALSAGAWLMAALIAGASTRERLLWLGWSLLIPAALILLIGVSMNAPFATGWVRFGLNEARWSGDFAYSPAFREALMSTVGVALQTVANGFLAVGAAAGAIGLGMIVWGFYTPADRKPVAMPPASSGNQAVMQ